MAAFTGLHRILVLAVIMAVMCGCSAHEIMANKYLEDLPGYAILQGVTPPRNNLTIEYTVGRIFVS